MPLLNLGIVAHVDAGKTSLTERLLFEAGAIDAPGSVDAGTTRTDSMDLERRRGITIRASVTAFALDDLRVTIIDTPGHPDFIAEVERSLTVLDAAVLVLSAVEGVQPQTVVIWRALRRIGVPTLLFVNKVDRRGADLARVVEQIRRRLSPDPVLLGRVEAEGTQQARVCRIRLSDESVLEAVAGADDRLLAQWVEGGHLDEATVAEALRGGVCRGTLAPVLSGSAITGAGIGELRSALSILLRPAPVADPGPSVGASRGAAGSAAERAEQPDRPSLSASVFAVDRDDRGRRAWIRLWDGKIRVRDRPVSSLGAGLVTEIAVCTPDGMQRRPLAEAGEVAVVRGLARVQVGDVLGSAPRRVRHRFAPATVQALVEPVDPSQRTALYAGLLELADEDPLIDLRVDVAAGEAAVSLHGAVQQEVIAALLEERYAVCARFADLATICIERVVGTGVAVEELGLRDNPYLATIGLRIDAAPVGHGVGFSPGVQRGNLPPAFITATEHGVRAALRQGLLGWAVTDCVVTMTASKYFPRQSRPHQGFDKSMSTVAADFRNLAPVVVATMLARARTRVCQPIDLVEVEFPEGSVGAVAALLGRLGGVTLETSAASGYIRLVARLPTRHTAALTRTLPDLTGGEGALVCSFDHYAPVLDGNAPVRPRTGPDPADRLAWFRDVPR